MSLGVVGAYFVFMGSTLSSLLIEYSCVLTPKVVRLISIFLFSSDLVLDERFASSVDRALVMASIIQVFVKNCLLLSL